VAIICFLTSVSSTHATRGTSTQRPVGAPERPSRPLGQALPALIGTRAGTGESRGAPTSPAAAVVRVLGVVAITDKTR